MAENTDVALDTTEKTGNSMMDSRKAKAYLIAEFTSKGIVFAILAVIAYQVTNGQTPSMGLIWLAMVVVVVAGFMEAGYIGSQAWIDRYTGTVKDVAKTVAGAISGESSGSGE